MKKFLLPPFLAIVALSLAGCGPKSADVPPAPEQQPPAAQPTQPQPADVAQQPVANPAVAEHAPQPEVVGESRTTSAPEQGNYEVFYNELEPDGDWIQTDNYGYVWHPRVAESDPNWRPYQNGHWVYTDSGWAWVSDERFGWATYHYGRWTELGRTGWVWVPGTQWAPAWVSWRNGNDYVGWAPLPPEARIDHDRHDLGRNVDAEFRIGAGNYMFVQIAQFRAPRVKNVVVDRSQNTTIINQTTNITNITNTNTVVVNNNSHDARPAVVNQGPQADMIAARTRQPVQKLTLSNEQPGARTTTVAGDKLQIAAPALIAPPGSAPQAPKHVKEKVTSMNAVAPPAPAPSAAHPGAPLHPSATQPPQPQPAAVKPESAQPPKTTPTTPTHATTPEPKATPVKGSHTPTPVGSAPKNQPQAQPTVKHLPPGTTPTPVLSRI